MADTLPPLPVKHVVVDGLWEEVRGPYTADEVEEIRAQAVAEAVAKERERWQSLLLSAVQEAEIHARQRREFVIKVDERGWWCERAENAIRFQPPRAGEV